MQTLYRVLKRIPFNLLGCLCILAIAHAAQATIPTSERTVLENLFNGTNGQGWTTNTNWCNGSCPASDAFTFNAGGTE